MIITKDKILKPIDSFTFLDLKGCDLFCDFNELDLFGLLNELNNYSLTLRSDIGLDEKVTFGIEIEYENPEYEMVLDVLTKSLNINMDDSMYKRWGVKVDISMPIRENGKRYNGEVISPILKDTPETWEQVKKVCTILKSLGATNENLSAGHIHFGTQIIGNVLNHWLNMLSMWMVNENIIYRFLYGEMLGPRKSITEYSNKIGDILYKLLPRLSILKSSRELKGNLIEGKSRALNFTSVNFKNLHNFIENNTIEVRVANGTLNEIVWQNNVNFLSKFILYNKSSKFDKGYITSKLNDYKIEDSNLLLYNQIYLRQALELVDRIFCTNLDKLYFLKQYLKSFQVPNGPEDYTKKIKL